MRTRDLLDGPGDEWTGRRYDATPRSVTEGPRRAEPCVEDVVRAQDAAVAAVLRSAAERITPAGGPRATFAHPRGRIDPVQVLRTMASRG